MSTVEMRRDLLEMQKLVQDIETELARRHNWKAQEEFWAHEAKSQVQHLAANDHQVIR